jgi:hypothetical protein
LSFNESTRNPLDQLSPRIALSYNINADWTVDANVGRYFQLPPFTALGYVGADGDNQSLRFIQADHYVLGSTRFLPWNAKASAEGFYKAYQYYPLLLRDSISLATLGGDFGVIGNRAAHTELNSPTSKSCSRVGSESPPSPSCGASSPTSLGTTCPRHGTTA